MCGPGATQGSKRTMAITTLISTDMKRSPALERMKKGVIHTHWTIASSTASVQQSYLAFVVRRCNTDEFDKVSQLACTGALVCSCNNHLLQSHCVLFCCWQL